MPNDTTPAAVAKHGDKMIEVRIRFWTDGIADQEHAVEPKHAWTTGIVVMDTNKSHGITPNKPKPFNSILDRNRPAEPSYAERGGSGRMAG